MPGWGLQGETGRRRHCLRKWAGWLRKNTRQSCGTPLERGRQGSRKSFQIECLRDLHRSIPRKSEKMPLNSCKTVASGQILGKVMEVWRPVRRKAVSSSSSESSKPFGFASNSNDTIWE